MNFRRWLPAILGLTSALSAGPAYAINGEAASPQVLNQLRRSVVSVRPDDHSSTCTGVLISRRHVLTSAHCVRTDMPMEINFLSSPKSETLYGARIHMHPVWLENLAGYTEFKELGNEWNRRYRRINRRIEQVIADFTNLEINKSCRFSEEGIAAIPNAEKFEQYLLRFERIQQIRKRIVLKSDEAKEKRAKCDAWIAERLEIYQEKNRLDAISTKLLTEPVWPGDLAVIELPQAVRREYQPMKMEPSFDFQKASLKNVPLVIAGIGKQAIEGSGTLSAGLTKILKVNSEEIIAIGGSAILCTGDSGGPTAYLNNGELVLVAVNTDTITASRGKTCVLGENEGHSTALAPYLEWINHIVNK